jgi:predicted aminopeptidase
VKKRWWLMSVTSLTGLLLTTGLLTALVCSTSGCSNLGYYAQSLNGHWQVLRSARPVSSWLADPATDERLRKQLQQSQSIRDFAVRELHLPENASYRRYADLKRPAVVWNVAAAPALSLQLHTWCFPIAGCVGYRGYFARDQAHAQAQLLRSQGLETTVYGVPAYSTLGRLPFEWMADPLLNTFINNPDAELARMIFHELAHQVAYAADDTAFNESFATAVEVIGLRKWLQDQPQAQAQWAQIQARKVDFQNLTQHFAKQLQALYQSRSSNAEKRQQKTTLMRMLQNQYQALKTQKWQGYKGYDAWFERANNASMAMVGTYNNAVPAFERLFERQGQDWERFYREVGRLKNLPHAQRWADLRAAP